MTRPILHKPKAFRKTLLIDDNEIDNMIFRKLSSLSAFSDELVSFTNPIEATHYLKNIETDEAPDVIFIDMKLPIISGLELISDLKDELKSKKIKVFILTSGVSPNEEKKIREEPLIAKLLLKPIEVEKLQELKKTYA